MKNNKEQAIRFTRYYCAKCSYSLPHSPEQVYKEWIDQLDDIDKVDI